MRGDEDFGPVADRVFDAAREVVIAQARARAHGSGRQGAAERMEAWILLDALELEGALLRKLDDMRLHDDTNEPADGFTDAVEEIRDWLRDRRRGSVV